MLKKVIIVLLFVGTMYTLPEIMAAFNNTPDFTFAELEEKYELSSEKMNEFFANPSEEAMVKFDVVISETSMLITQMEAHNTIWARLFRLEPMLTKSERNRLKELRQEHDTLVEKYVQLIVKELYDAQEIDFYDIPPSHYLSFNAKANTPKLLVKGAFDVRDNTIFQHHYFLLRTPGQNYVIPRPNDYSVTIDGREVTFRFDKSHYKVESTIIHE